MPDKSQRRRSWLGAGFGALALAVLLCPAAVAQTHPDYNVTSRVDAYGNVRPVYSGRRPVDVFQNQTQRRALLARQAQGRRVDRRGGYNPFALPGDVLNLTRFRPGQSVRSPYQPAGPARWQQRAFNRYGGFDSRLGRDEAINIATILDRRQELIAATSLNAPVHRVYQRTPPGLGLPPALASTPFAPGEPGEPTESNVALDERLRTEADDSHARVRTNAWTWFAEGNYRRAARSFETASMLEPSDSTARIGELFCRLSIGATQTAVALLRELDRREQNPFLYDIDLADAYGEVTEAPRVRVAVGLQAGIGTENPDVRALHALVLWYLGERDEAGAVALSLSRDHPGSAYADWPIKMRNARAVLDAHHEQAEP